MEIRVPITDNAVLSFWAAQAEMHGHSLEEEVGLLLTQGASFQTVKSQEIDEANKAAKKAAAWKRIHDRREEIRKLYGTLPDSTAMIREERDLRG